MILTSSDLIKSVRSKMMLSKVNSSKNWDNEGIILTAHEILLSMQAEIANAAPKLYQQSRRVPLKQIIRIPSDAISNDIEIRDEDGDLVSPEQYRFEGSNIIFNAQVKRGFVNLVYPRCISRLVPLANANDDYERAGTRIRHINDDLITCDYIPLHWLSGMLLDLYSPFMPEPILRDIEAINMDSSDNSIILNVKTAIKATGYYLCAAGETVMPQIPQQMFAYFSKKVAIACLSALGDEQAARLLSLGMDQERAESLNQVSSDATIPPALFEPNF